MDTTYYSLEALASALALPKGYLRRLAEAGTLPRLEVSAGRYRYDLEAVRQALRDLADTEAGTRGVGTMVCRDGGDGEILTIPEAAEVLGVETSEVARVVGGAGVRPAHVIGGRTLRQRGQLRAVRDLLEGKKPARPDPVPFPGPGLVRHKPADQ